MKMQGKDGKWYEIPDQIFGDRDGRTYVPCLDRFRLDTWEAKVYLYLATHGWVTKEEIRDFWDGSSITAIGERIRDLRKAKFGRMTVSARRVKGGLWEYRLEDFGDYGGVREWPNQPSGTSTAHRVLTVAPHPSNTTSMSGWRIVPSSP